MAGSETGPPNDPALMTLGVRWLPKWAQGHSDPVLTLSGVDLAEDQALLAPRGKEIGHVKENQAQ